jgi:RNA polymerase sigma factor (sigma-70 family)
MVNDKSICFVKNENGEFYKITYKELKDRKKNDPDFNKRKFVVASNMLFEVSKEKFNEYHNYVEKTRYAYNKENKLDKVSFDVLEDNFILPNDDAISNIEKNIESREEKERLNNAILKLTKDEQDLVKAIYFKNMTMTDYAEITNTPLSTISSRKQKIIKKLKNLFNIS